MTPRRMDCIDCHNRPSHIYRDPDSLADLALSTGRIDTSLPSVKKHVVEILAASYQDTPDALTGIANAIGKAYEASTNHAAVLQAIAETQRVYTNNFFPEMKVSWRAYPNNIGHMIFPGCFRCHDGKHVSDTAKRLPTTAMPAIRSLGKARAHSLPVSARRGLNSSIPATSVIPGKR